jgi:hypothetical protein
MFVRMLAGFVEGAAGVAVAVWWRQRHPVHGPGDEAAQFVHGAAQLLYFLFATGWGWLAGWLFGEGILRVLAAAMQQPFSSLPVVLARGAWALRPKRRLPLDVVSARGAALVIDSAHDYDWHALTTVDVDGALFAVTREAGTPERPHRFVLTPIAHDHVVRTVTRYVTSARDGSGRTGRPARR